MQKLGASAFFTNELNRFEAPDSLHITFAAAVFCLRYNDCSWFTVVEFKIVEQKKQRCEFVFFWKGNFWFPYIFVFIYSKWGGIMNRAIILAWRVITFCIAQMMDIHYYKFICIEFRFRTIVPVFLLKIAMRRTRNLCSTTPFDEDRQKHKLFLLKTQEKATRF